MTSLEFAVIQMIAQAARFGLKRELTMPERHDRFQLEGDIMFIVNEIEAREAAVASNDPGEDVDDDR